MPRRFTNIGQFVGFLEAAMLRVEKAESAGLEKAAQRVEGEVKSLFGHYQDAAGGFSEWPELADSTKEDRVRQGFAPDEPLLRTGTLRDSVHHVVHDTAAAVGSDDPRAIWQELGTFRAGQQHIPPRSFFGIGAVHSAEDAAKIIGKHIAYAIIGKRPPVN